MPYKHIFPDEVCHFGHLVRYSISATILAWSRPVIERPVSDTARSQSDGKIEIIEANEASTGKSIETNPHDVEG